MITSEILVAYTQCKLKAYLILCTENKGIPHDYISIIDNEIEKNRAEYFNKIKLGEAEFEYFSLTGMNRGVKVLLDVTLSHEDMIAYTDAIIRNEKNSYKRTNNYAPSLVVGSHKMYKDQKLQLAFVGYVLSKFQKQKVLTGIIVTSGNKKHNIRLENLYIEIKNILKNLKTWIKNSKSESPQLVLNKNCPICPFYKQCKEKAEEMDKISLLGGLSQKAIQKYQKKGIFTINQLSFLFRPRKQRKRKKKSKILPRFRPELQALAIRTKKIYIQELPVVVNHEIELFVDIEGIPDQNFYYLIGLLKIEYGKPFYYSFWANSKSDEQHIWKDFIEKVNEYPNVPIYHYGAYDSKALQQLKRRYGKDSDTIENRLININTSIFGKIYFPVKSNSLKEIGLFLGAIWNHPASSGLQSIVWRYQWNESGNNEYKNLLLNYNSEDCNALHLLTEKLKIISETAHFEPSIDFANQPKKYASDIGNTIHKDFEQILKFTYANYDKSKISFSSDSKDQQSVNNKAANRKSYVRIVPKPSKVVNVSRMRKCPLCKNALKELERNAEIIITDLIFTKTGCRKTIIKYIGKKTFCNNCRRTYDPKIISNFHRRKFGHTFMAWAVYQRIILRLPYRIIAQTMEDMFNECAALNTILQFIYYFADYYVYTEQLIVKQILKSPFVHVDETKINIRGENYYVWVFTDGKYVIYKLTENRDATIAHDFFKNYSGIVISDFFAGYDSLKCRQQKCWSHLIRDLNEDLWREPFNYEFEQFVLEIKNLLLPIFKTIQKYGLKKRNFNKFIPSVEKFYKINIEHKVFNFEVTVRYQKRFIRYKDSLFTFLKEDGISWNNIMAERAIKPVAIQRKISTIFFEQGASKYLSLLGVAQSCKFQNKPFLKFLLSKEKDIDKFKAPKPLKYSRILSKNEEKNDNELEQEQEQERE